MPNSDGPDSIHSREAPTIAPRRAAAASTEVIFIATLDKVGVERIARQMSGTAIVRQVVDPRALEAALTRSRLRRPHLVIDCCAPAFDPLNFAKQLPKLPEGSRVVLWGVTPETLEAVQRTVPGAQSWSACPAATSHAGVADLLMRII